MSLKSHLQLMRLPNAFTAMADPLAGALVAAGAGVGDLPLWGLALLMATSACLYTAGIVFNDLFDYELDRAERPERPLPSGRVSRGAARALGVALMTAGLACAATLTFIPIARGSCESVWQGLVMHPTFPLAVILAGIILAYDAVLKHLPVMREAGMGTCRATNFLLGATFGIQFGAPSPALWIPAVVLFIYVATLTAISRYEMFAAARRAVKWLVLGIIVLDAIFVAAFQSPLHALWVLALLVPALVLGKIFEMA
jgi:4-hydroxybenzoate polyprenyltransferase